ncbi:NAD-dependent protein deacetylase sirtuin-3, mitochondrial isoform X2 [Python bivittatus]|uniref:NAD-dependent protein deacetylase sirtuin-3, mitochondrial isoform X2 n=1 Tax=Python bivittatus TaxID=176946 RepID=A0A9F2MZ91_PYTBI|nr:NAD-dependent protein deacetylase sirtuin-3, mitochondrial isoform X2 [Python bivittatus]
MNRRWHFRMSARRAGLQAAKFQRLTGWNFPDFWMYAQHQHFKNSSSLTACKNLPLIPLRSVLSFPHGKLLPQKTSESTLKNTTGLSGIRVQEVRFLSLSTLSRVFFGIGQGGNNGGNKKLSLRDVMELIRKKECHRIVVMAGAGLSTPSGIPDFRSPGSGLYNNLQQYNIPYPEAIFELSYFFQNPKPFFRLAKELYPGNYRPNYAHYFLRLLFDKGLLLRLYTQNIDGLERVAGIPPDKLVEAHGTFASATCTVCRRSYSGEDFRGDVMTDKIPKCPVCTGVVKPDIIFFGEELPHRFFLYMTDFPMADLLFIIGTSLEVWAVMHMGRE